MNNMNNSHNIINDTDNDEVILDDDTIEYEDFSFWQQFYKLHIAIPLIISLNLLLFSPLISYLFNEYQQQKISLGDYMVIMDLEFPELPIIEAVDYYELLKLGVPTLFDDVIIKIPSLNVEGKVVPPPENYSVSIYNTLLKQGPVFLTDSVPPGASGNVSITAHRVGHGYYFKDLDFLKEGDEIILDTPEYVLYYRFVESTIVNEYNWSLILDHSHIRRLVLHTCDPKTTYQPTPNRLIVRAELDNIEKKDSN